MSFASVSTIVKFHEFPSGSVLHSYQPKSDGPIRSISWSKGGNWLALVPQSGPVEIVSVKEHPKLIHTIHAIEEPSCASFQNTTKRNIAVTTKSGQVLIYDIKTRSVKKRYPRAPSALSMVEFTTKDNHIVAACSNGETYIYSNIHNNVSGRFKIPRSQSVTALRTNPIQRNYIVAGSNEGVVAVWDIHANKNKFFTGAHKAPVTAVAFSPINSNLVVSMGLDRQFCLYDTDNKKCIGNIFVENNMTAVDFSPDGKFIVMASQKGKMYIYDTKNIQQPLVSFQGHDDAVEHLSFRKCEDFESSVLCSEDCSDSQTAVTNDTQDSFPVVTISDCETTKEQKEKSVDSFLAAMNFSTGSPSVHKFTPGAPSKLLQDGLKVTSTPQFLAVDSPLPPPESPIADAVADHPSSTILANVEDLVRSAFKHESQAISEQFKQQMQFYAMTLSDQIRQVYLDLTMTLVRQSITTEDNFNTLRAENLMLKQKIDELEERIAMMNNNEI